MAKSGPPTVREQTVVRPVDAAPSSRRRVNKVEVLREATRLFAERGYDGMSMGDLAASVGLRKASLFHHFPTKDALYERVLTDLVERLQKVIVGTLSAERPILERLDLVSDALTSALGDEPHAARLLVGQAVHGVPLAEAIVGQVIERVLGAARAFVEKGQREGVFDRDLDPSHVVLSLVGSYFLPFSMEGIVERFMGTKPGHPGFTSGRIVASREQLRRMLGVRRDARPTPPSKPNRGKAPRQRPAARRSVTRRS
jgi:TetR/AcrR family transcriptional regulator